ncbi:30 kDa heat shock protein [Pyronema domesticum]|nr:30 kDa heat shock protein [Pyronema domesticum]
MFDEIDRATSSGSSTSSTSRRAFSPTFDVHETEHEYVLEGEFPGLSDKNNVSIEFTDDKTILISGKIEREFKGWKDEQGKLESAEEQKKIEGGQTTAGQEAEKSDKKVEKKEKLKSPKYWVSERSVGEFSRSFSFPGPVDIDQVKASLEHGILKIVVPKMEKRTGRKIEIC